MSSEWVIAAASLVNAVVIIGLAYVTKRYADETKRIADATRMQAEASARMAKEMEQTRFATAKPIIELRPQDFDSTEGLRIALGGPPPTNLQCRLRNVGVGPALNVVIPIRMNHDLEGTRRADVLQPGEDSG
jgi:hypothetical protein